MSFSPSQIGWIMEQQFIQAVGFELADTNDTYRATGVSPSIGSWGRSVTVSPLEAAKAEIEAEIDPPLSLIIVPPRSVSWFEWVKFQVKYNDSAWYWVLIALLGAAPPALLAWWLG